MKLITLTRANDCSKVFVNPDAISMVSKCDDDKTTIVSLIGDSFAYVMVKESPNVVAELAQVRSIAVKALNTMPSAEPETDDYCDTCKEYDLVKHSCPRFNRVIRTALESITVQKKGKWIDRGYLQIGFHCSDCGGYVMSGTENFCPWCGADMRGEQNE